MTITYALSRAVTKITEESAVEEPKATETETPEYIGAAAGKYQWGGQSGGDADKDVQGEAISKYRRKEDGEHFR